MSLSDYLSLNDFYYTQQREQAVSDNLRNSLATDPKATDEKRYEALRLAADHTHATPDEVVKRAQAYFEFLKGAAP